MNSRGIAAGPGRRTATRGPRLFLAAAIRFVALLALAGGARAAESPRVVAVEFSGAVNPVSQDYIVGEIERANREGYGMGRDGGDRPPNRARQAAGAGP